MICDKSKQLIKHIIEEDKYEIKELINADNLQIGNTVHTGGFNNYYRTHIGINFTIDENKYVLNIANPEYQGDEVIFSKLCKLEDDGKMFIKSEIIGFGYDLDSIFEMAEL